MRTEREKHGLIGPVKSVRVETALFEGQAEKLIEQTSFSHTMTFNQDGWLIEQLTRNPDGSEWRAANDYSDSGRLLATRTYDLSGALNEVWYIYDDEGRLVAGEQRSSDGKVTTPMTYAYDGTGEKVRIRKLDFSGKKNLMIGIEGTNTSISASEAQRVESRYNTRGEVIEVKVFNTRSELVSRVEITRDAMGNPLEEVQYTGDVVPFGPRVSESGSTEEMPALSEEQQAEFVQEIKRMFGPGTAMFRHAHSYDESGRLIESRLTMMGMETSRQTFAYDEAGNKSEEVSYNGGGTGNKAFYTREYDENGNWTKELVSTASSWDAEFGLAVPAQVTRRIITYW
jgi:hypothetical protein